MEFSREEFERKLDALRETAPEKHLAVAVSGGPDSMALLWLLSKWAEKRNIRLHAYTVDHGLRAESAQEARSVGEWVKDWPGVTHKILTWEGGKPESRLLEEARAARYGLMAAAMKDEGLKHLFIAHHRDDQAETFLFRLAKGSGLDGLAGMQEIHVMENGITLVRPLLDASKDDLIQICKVNDVPYVDDPTNKNEHYFRPRLRAAREILEGEGLSSKRLAVTARRLARAKSALEDLARDIFAAALQEKRNDGFLFDYKALSAAHEELVLRVLSMAMNELRPESDYGPRMERLENLLERILYETAFKSATLGGCLFALDRKNETLWVGKE